LSGQETTLGQLHAAVNQRRIELYRKIGPVHMQGEREKHKWFSKNLDLRAKQAAIQDFKCVDTNRPFHHDYNFLRHRCNFIGVCVDGSAYRPDGKQAEWAARVASTRGELHHLDKTDDYFGETGMVLLSHTAHVFRHLDRVFQWLNIDLMDDLAILLAALVDWSNKPDGTPIVPLPESVLKT
jgi:hypothetical protein